MMGMGKKVSDVLGPKKPETESEYGGSDSETPSYDAFADELKDILGLDDDKAQRLRDVICGLAREEMDMGDEEEAAPSEAPKKRPGLAIVLRAGKPSKG